MNKKRLLSVFAIAAILASCGSKQGKPNFGDNEYAVRTIATQSAELQTTYPAIIRGVQDVEIRPKVSGFITKLCVHEGQTVKKGQALFVIDNVTYAAAERQARAAVNAAQSQLSTAKLTYENSQKLYQNNVIGDYELQSANNAYLSAKAALGQAEAAHASAKEALSFCFVNSPANGVVGTLPYKVGALVSPSTPLPLTTVSNNSEMQVFFSMAEKDILGMAKDAGSMQEALKALPQVRLLLNDGTAYTHEGRIATASGVIDPATGSVQLRADFANPEHLLKSGGSGSISIPRSANESIIIPMHAVAQVQNLYFVYVVGKDNKVKYTAVEVAPDNDGNNYIITKGLKAGDRIVVNGITKLTDGMEITPITEKQNEEKLKKATELGKSQSDLGKLKEAMTN